MPTVCWHNGSTPMGHLSQFTNGQRCVMLPLTGIIGHFHQRISGYIFITADFIIYFKEHLLFEQTVLAYWRLFSFTGKQWYISIIDDTFLLNNDTVEIIEGGMNKNWNHQNWKLPRQFPRTYLRCQTYFFSSC